MDSRYTPTLPRVGHRGPSVWAGVRPDPRATASAVSTASLSVVIPAYNEESRLPATLAQVSSHLQQRGVDYEILVVVNGSTDRTAEVTKAAADRDPNIRLILTSTRGKGRAVKIGVDESQGDRIVFCDADLSTPIDEAVALADRLDQSFQIVIASREGSGARRLGEPNARHLMGRVFNGLVRTFAVPGIQDTQCGFKAFARACAREVFARQTIDGFGFDVEILYIARRRGFGILEVPVTWEYRSSSRVDPLRDTFRMVADIVRVRLNGLRGRYD